jgi:anaerobic selenocysteine-containing dehydrogenase
MFTSAAINLTNSKPGKHRFGRWHSRVSQLPEFAGELPMSAFIEEILTPGEGQIKAMVTSCGNPVLSAPNGRQIDQALEGLDFMVSIDIYLNETTRHADIILPPATGVETAHLGMFFHNLAVHNTVKYSEPSVDKAEGAKYDWEIFSELKVAYEKEVARINDANAPQQPTYDLETTLSYMLASSPYRLDELKAQAHGIDLGPLQANIAGNKLRTADAKINLFPAIYQEPLASLQPPTTNPDQLSLIGRRDLRSMNSWLHNSLRMVKGKEVCTAQIHPEDAKKRAIEQGQVITVSTQIGQIRIKAEISDEVGIGTICIPHGWGHNRKGTRLRVAAEHQGVSYNDLADEKRTDKIAGTAAVNGFPVYVK